MDPRYAQLYRDLHQRHWWWRAREGMILEHLRRLAITIACTLSIGANITAHDLHDALLQSTRRGELSHRCS